MAKKFKIQSAVRKVIDDLNSINRGISTSVRDTAIRQMANNAVEVARETIKATDHTQKWGDLLASAVDFTVEDGTAKIYAPAKQSLDNRITTSNDDELRAQMYYLEYGAGLVSGKNWGYTSTEYDKNPNKRKLKYGKMADKWVAHTNISKAAGYMKAARRYLIKNARGILANEINLFLTRKYYRAKRKSTI